MAKPSCDSAHLVDVGPWSLHMVLAFDLSIFLHRQLKFWQHVETQQKMSSTSRHSKGCYFWCCSESLGGWIVLRKLAIMD